VGPRGHHRSRRVPDTSPAAVPLKPAAGTGAGGGRLRLPLQRRAGPRGGRERQGHGPLRPGRRRRGVRAARGIDRAGPHDRLRHGRHLHRRLPGRGRRRGGAGVRDVGGRHPAAHPDGRGHHGRRGGRLHRRVRRAQAHRGPPQRRRDSGPGLLWTRRPRHAHRRQRGAGPHPARLVPRLRASASRRWRKRWAPRPRRSPPARSASP
jgi:hypothetical protein